jgi:hypothetical protein
LATRAPNPPVGAGQELFSLSGLLLPPARVPVPTDGRYELLPAQALRAPARSFLTSLR